MPKKKEWLNIGTQLSVEIDIKCHALYQGYHGYANSYNSCEKFLRIFMVAGTLVQKKSMILMNFLEIFWVIPDVLE